MGTESIAVVVAILASLLFAGTAVSVRVGSLRSNIIDGVLASTVLSVPIALLAAALNGEFEAVGQVTPATYLYFVLVGLIHYYAARYLGYHSISRVGANVGSMLMHSSALFAPVLAFAVLREAISLRVLIEVFLIMLGITLTSYGEWRWSAKGVVAGVLSGLLMAVSSIIVKVAYGIVYAPSIGVMIASATGLTLAVLTKRLVFKEPVGILGIPRAYWVVSLTATTGQLARFVAIGLAPVSLVVPLTHMVPVFTVVLSFFTIRGLERFSPRVVLGVVLAFLGSVVAYFGVGV